MQLKFANSVLTYIICIYVSGCHSTNNTSTSLEISSQTTENSTLTKIFKDDIQKPDLTTNLTKIETKNNTQLSPKPKKSKRIRTKNKMSTNLPPISENVNLNATTRRTTKRRRRKKKRKKTQTILEITTTKVSPNNTFVINDTNFHNLIHQLNNNPEKTLKIDEISKIFDKNSNATLSLNIHQNNNQTKKMKNRCARNNGGCSQICKQKGKQKCSCFRGYALTKNRKKCVDIDECKSNNGGCKHTCKNTPGGFYCACPEGFRIYDDLKSCQDVNECFLRNGHGPCQDTCTNTLGSYTCDCSRLNGTRLADDKHSCEDINECEEGSSGCTHLCINTVGAAFCSCPEGMELMSDYKTCQDVDECEDQSVRKSCGDSCVNTIGSYYCERDFQSDQFFNHTKIPVCPPLDPPEHGFFTCLRNTSLMYKNGRKILKNIPGTRCHLVCPVGFKLVGSNRLVCGMSGQWLIVKKGFCTSAPNPTLECPPDQTVSLDGNRDKVSVSFSPPRTNVRWQIVKSYPSWAKNLRGELEEGRHSIQFSVTDPATKLSSACSFFITVKK